MIPLAAFEKIIDASGAAAATTSRANAAASGDTDDGRHRAM